MKRLIIFLIFMLLICLLAIGCADDNAVQEETLDTSTSAGENNTAESATETNSPEIFTSMPDAVWNNANIEYSGFSSKDEFLAETEYYIDAISKLTSNKAKWYDIEYRLTDEMSYIDWDGKDIIYLKKDLFEHDLAPIANMTARLLCPNENSTSLHEGLISYCQDIFGKNPSIHNYGLDADAWANLLLVYYPDQFNTLFPDIGMAETKNTLSYNELRQSYCLLCSSFVKYLINTYGIDNFMLLYESDNLESDYKNICGASLDDIKTAWRQEIENYSKPISPEELQIYLQELHILHNVMLE